MCIQEIWSGIEELSKAMKDHYLAGQSGVGKSTIINNLHPGKEWKPVMSVKDKAGQAYYPPCGMLIPMGMVADTPTVRLLDLNL